MEAKCVLGRREIESVVAIVKPSIHCRRRNPDYAASKQN
jgi:hypothetical protein